VLSTSLICQVLPEVVLMYLSATTVVLSLLFLQPKKATKRVKNAKYLFLMWKNGGFVGKYQCFFAIIRLFHLSLRSQIYG
jgi:hypothetical protein